MIISDDLLKELRATFSIVRVMNIDSWSSAQRVLGQVDVVDWLTDRQKELNRKAVTGGDHQVTVNMK